MEKSYPKQVPSAVCSRVSTKEQKEGENIEAHISELLELMQKDGSYLWEKKGGIYKDEGYSGALLARPDLDRLRDDAKKGRFRVVYFLAPDRLARDNHYIGLIVNELKERGITCVFKNLPVSHGAEGDLMLNVFGSFAQYERAQIAERFRRGKIHKAKNKKLIVGGPPPYAIRYIKKNPETDEEGYYELIAGEVPVIQKIFELLDYERQFTIRQVARWLTDQKIPTPKGAKKWARSTVQEIARRSEYIGIAYYNKRKSVLPTRRRTSRRYRKQVKTSQRLRPKEEWIPIPVPECRCISEGRFWRVQKRLEENRTFAKRNRKRRSYLVSGLLRCKDPCGSTWFGCTTVNPNRTIPYYRCTNRLRMHPLPRTCYAKMIPADTLDAAVWNALREIVKNPQILMAHVQKLQKHCKDNSTIIERIALEQKALDNLANTEARIFEAYKAGAINVEKLQEEQRKIQNQKNVHERTLSALLPRKNHVLPPQLVQKSVNDYCNYVQDKLNKIDGDFETKQKLIRSFVSNGTVGDGNVTFNCRISAGAFPNGFSMTESSENIIENATGEHRESSDVSMTQIAAVATKGYGHNSNDYEVLFKMLVSITNGDYCLINRA